MITISDAGPQTTVQDLGRAGQLRYGIPPSGPVDRFAFVLANRLVGNADTAAALECTLMGPRFEVGGPLMIAVTGADMALTVNGREAAGWAAIALASKPSFMITHSPGHMFITDVPNSALSAI